jgi:hypothetical protein
MATFSLVAVAALSVELGLRVGGLGLGVGGTSDLGVLTPLTAGGEFILVSDLIASFVENIRVSRFVIDGFSVGSSSVFCGSAGGAAVPFPLRLTVLGTATPFGIAGCISGDATAEEVVDGREEELVFSVMRESLRVVTAAMILVARGTANAVSRGVEK